MSSNEVVPLMQPKVYIRASLACSWAPICRAALMPSPSRPSRPKKVTSPARTFARSLAISSLPQKPPVASITALARTSITPPSVSA